MKLPTLLAPLVLSALAIGAATSCSPDGNKPDARAPAKRPTTPATTPPTGAASAESSAELSGFTPEYRALIDGYNRKTDARQISVPELRKLADANSAVVILDVREPQEIAVSQIPGARRLSPSEVDSFAETIPPETPIVTYCTAGYRAGFAAVALERKLGRPVQNLDGGIVAWFNAGGRVVDPQGNAVDQVHAYGPTWERFVRPRVTGAEDDTADNTEK